MYSGAEKITSLKGGCQAQLLITACLHLPPLPLWIKMLSVGRLKKKKKVAFYLFCYRLQLRMKLWLLSSGGMTDALLTLLSRLMECVWKQYHRGRCVHLFFFFLLASRHPDSLIPPKGHIVINVIGWKSEMGREVSIAKVLTAHQMEFLPNPLA